jgi:SAM-dependent methyltransferase
MLDYVYGGLPPPETTSIGKQVFSGTTRASSGLSVIERRNYLAKLIDNTARETTRPRILSVACGHLREANYSEAIRSGAVATFYALDQDPESLAVVERDKPEEANIITVNASVKDLLQGKASYSNLNLIYALGLYDYLNDPIAQKLTQTLFDMLAPDGKLVLANYAPDSQARGYMEAFMDWFLNTGTSLPYRHAHPQSIAGKYLEPSYSATAIETSPTWKSRDLIDGKSLRYRAC